MRVHSDQWAALTLIAFAALIYGLTYQFDEVPAAIRQGMGPEVFPRLVAIVITMLSLWLMIAARGKVQVPLERIDPAVPWVMAGGVAFMGLVWLVGITVAMGIAIVALGVLWGERQWGAMLANAVLLPAIIWALFVKGLKVPLPVGKLGQMLGL